MTELDGPRRPARSGTARALVVLLHGYGADGGDLIALADELAPALPEAAFVAPDAPHPCGMAPGGREWFPLTFRDPSEYARGVETAAPVLARFLDRELARHRLGPGDLALVGFSQGTMMALHVGPRRRPPPRAIVGFSGLLAGADRLTEGSIAPCPVLLVHGTEDELIPAAMTLHAASALAAAGCPAEWHLRPGIGHGIDAEGLAMAADFLAKTLTQPADRAGRSSRAASH